jgi:hypothetical protein
VVGRDVAAVGFESHPASNMSFCGDFLPSTRLSKSTSPFDALETPLDPTGAPNDVRALELVAAPALLEDRSLSLRTCSSSTRVDSDLMSAMNA